MAYIVEEIRHRTGRHRIRFADEFARSAGRDFLRRFAKAGGRLRDYEKVRISFDDLWSFDNRFRSEHPNKRLFREWYGKANAVKRLAGHCRSTGRGVRQVLGLIVPLRPIRVDENFMPILDKEGRPVLDDESPLNGLFAPPWPPSLGRRLPAIADDLEALADILEKFAAPGLVRPPHAPPKERERQFRIEWHRLARERCRRPLDRLGAILFNALFDKRVSLASFKRQRQDDRRGKKVR